MDKRLMLVGVCFFCFGCSARERPAEPPKAVVVKEMTLVAAIQTPEPAAAASVAAPESSGAPREPDGAGSIIDEYRWGFSVYDPRTQETEYFTGTGSFLGKRKL